MINTEFISHHDLEMLLNNQNTMSMTIYMPTNLNDGQHSSARLKNIIYQAEKRMIENRIYNDRLKETLIKPLNNLLLQDEFWKNLSQGLAIYISQNIFEYYKLPIKFEEIVMINTRFYLKPIFPLFKGDSTFYILAIGKDRVRFLLSEGSNVKEIPLMGIPDNFGEIYHSLEQPFNPNIIYDENEVKANLLQNFYQINDSVSDVVHKKNIPLVLACSNKHCDTYKKANSYPYLIKDIIGADADTFTESELQQMAQQILDPIFKQSEKNEILRFKDIHINNRDSRKTTEDLEEIIPAAFYGQIDTLFLANNTSQWGRFEPENNTVFLSNEEKVGYQDLMDYTAIQTYLNGGKVYMLNKNEMPDNANMAALLKYPSSMRTKIMLS